MVARIENHWPKGQGGEAEAPPANQIGHVQRRASGRHCGLGPNGAMHLDARLSICHLLLG